MACAFIPGDVQRPAVVVQPNQIPSRVGGRDKPGGDESRGLGMTRSGRVIESRVKAPPPPALGRPTGRIGRLAIGQPGASGQDFDPFGVDLSGPAGQAVSTPRAATGPHGLVMHPSVPQHPPGGGQRAQPTLAPTPLADRLRPTGGIEQDRRATRPPVHTAPLRHRALPAPAPWRLRTRPGSPGYRHPHRPCRPRPPTASPGQPRRGRRASPATGTAL